MTQGREIRCYDYVNHPYEQVRDALRGDAIAVFQAATKTAASRAESVASELKVNIGGIDIGTDITISVGEIEEKEKEIGSQPWMKLPLSWEATEKPHLFPLMKAELTVYPLTATETQLDFAGNYQPPLGALGSVINAVVGHRIADAALHRFVNDVGRHLRGSLD